MDDQGIGVPNWREKPRSCNGHYWNRWRFEGHVVRFNTGKSFSEALILTSTNPQYDKRLFIELPVQYKKTICSEHVVYTNCSERQNKNKKTICVHNMFSWCSELVVFMYWTGNSMNNLLSYCGLVDARISASEKDLPF